MKCDFSIYVSRISSLLVAVSLTEYPLNSTVCSGIFPIAEIDPQVVFRVSVAFVELMVYEYPKQYVLKSRTSISSALSHAVDIFVKRSLL